MVTGKSIRVAQDLQDAYKACQQVSWITVESNPKAREQAVRNVVEFLGKGR